MRKSVLISILIIFTQVASVHASAPGGIFIPDFPIFQEGYVKCPEGYDPRSRCKLLIETFGYEQGDRGFEAAPGLITDGASIPFWAQTFIGESHEKAFVRASTLHDHYVLKDNSVLTYLATQKLFLDALLDSGVEEAKARLMYLAVLVGAPKWSLFYKAEPEACKLIKDKFCVRDAELPKPQYAGNFVPAAYAHKNFLKAVKAVTENIDIESADLEEIENRALIARLMLLGIETPPPVVVDPLAEQRQ